MDAGSAHCACSAVGRVEINLVVWRHSDIAVHLQIVGEFQHFFVFVDKLCGVGALVEAEANAQVIAGAGGNDAQGGARHGFLAAALIYTGPELGYIVIAVITFCLVIDSPVAHPSSALNMVPVFSKIAFL